MKKWFYSNISLLWLIMLLVILSMISYFTYKYTSLQTFEATSKLLLVVGFVSAPVGMVAFGVWGENKLKEMEKGE